MKRISSMALPMWAITMITLCLSVSAQALSNGQIQQACIALQQSPFAATELKVLSDVAHNTSNCPALRSRAMAAYSLTHLMQGNTQAFESATQLLHATDPDQDALVTVTRADAFITCDACKGSGKQTTLCPSCMGSGKCKVCAGTGVKDSATCAACKGKGLCAMCLGKQKIEIACPTCKGTCKVFSPSTKIRANFDALLTDIITLCQENERYAEMFRQISHESDASKRIAGLQRLLQSFSRRTDLIGPAQTLFDQAVKTRDAQALIRREQEEKAQANRDLDALRKRAESGDLAGTIASIDAYLKAHPHTPVQMELQSLQDELKLQFNHQVLARKIIYVVLALSGILFLISCLKPLLLRKKPDGFGPLPGMDKIDKNELTDPLSLTSKESKAQNTMKSDKTPPLE